MSAMKAMDEPASQPGTTPKLIAAWAFVGIPFAWGVFVTGSNAAALFR